LKLKGGLTYACGTHFSSLTIAEIERLRVERREEGGGGLELERV